MLQNSNQKIRLTIKVRTLPFFAAADSDKNWKCPDLGKNPKLTNKTNVGIVLEIIRLKIAANKNEKNSTIRKEAEKCVSDA